jgi:hypothetical protein
VTFEFNKQFLKQIFLVCVIVLRRFLLMAWECLQATAIMLLVQPVNWPATRFYSKGIYNSSIPFVWIALKVCHWIMNFSVIEDPLAAFEKLLKEKEERDRARKKRRSISRSRSRSRSRTRRSKSPRQRSRSRSGSPPRRQLSFFSILKILALCFGYTYILSSLKETFSLISLSCADLFQFFFFTFRHLTPVSFLSFLFVTVDVRRKRRWLISCWLWMV